ncbi:MAG: hypothetical protein ACOC9Q_00890 [bacterium]
MIDKVTAIRVGFRIAAIVLSLLGLFLAWQSAGFFTSSSVQRVRIIELDRIERERVTVSGQPDRWAFTAYVVCERMDDAASDSSGASPGDDEPLIAEWGSVEEGVEADALIGTEFWADMSHSPVLPVSQFALGLFIPPSLAALLLMLNVAPIRDEPDTETSLKWRSSKRDVFVGAAVIACAVPFIVMVASRAGALADFRLAPSIGLILSLALSIYMALTTFHRVRGAANEQQASDF